jgi:hypothetical protein
MKAHTYRLHFLHDCSGCTDKPGARRAGIAHVRPFQQRARGGDELWAVTAEGHTSLTVHPFTEALDVALTWAVESGGEIYRRDHPGAEPGLYKAAW